MKEIPCAAAAATFESPSLLLLLDSSSNSDNDNDNNYHYVTPSPKDGHVADANDYSQDDDNDNNDDKVMGVVTYTMTEDRVVDPNQPTPTSTTAGKTMTEPQPQGRVAATATAQPGRFVDGREREQQTYCTPKVEEIQVQEETFANNNHYYLSNVLNRMYKHITMEPIKNEMTATAASSTTKACSHAVASINSTAVPSKVEEIEEEEMITKTIIFRKKPPPPPSLSLVVVKASSSRAEEEQEDVKLPPAKAKRAGVEWTTTPCRERVISSPAITTATTTTAATTTRNTRYRSSSTLASCATTSTAAAKNNNNNNKKEWIQKNNTASAQATTVQKSKTTGSNSNNNSKLKGPVVVVKDEHGDIYYEVEHVLAKRYRKQPVASSATTDDDDELDPFEFKIRWKGCTSRADRWLTIDDLCDTTIEYIQQVNPPLVDNDDGHGGGDKKVASSTMGRPKKRKHNALQEDADYEYQRESKKLARDNNASALHGVDGIVSKEDVTLAKSIVPSKSKSRLGGAAKKSLLNPGSRIGSTRKRATGSSSLTTQQPRTRPQPKNKARTTKASRVPQGAAASNVNPRQITVQEMLTARSPKGLQFGGKHIEKVREAEDSEESKSALHFSLFTVPQILGKCRPLLFQRSLKAEVIETRIVEKDYTYELISSEVDDDPDASKHPHYSKPQILKLLYAEVSDLEGGSIQTTLQRMADFASLTPHKVVSRLALLQSPPCKFQDKSLGIFPREASEFCVIPDYGSDGCGFIAEEVLEELCRKARNPGKILGLQVRVLIPKLGLFKGMLCRKRILSGPPIQLTYSMQKVPASKDPIGQADDRAWLLITQVGLHHKKHSKIDYVRRLLDPNANDPPQSFKPEEPKEMILRMFQAKGVPQAVCKAYADRSMRPAHLRHAWIVGLADPTGKLPHGHVFITGMLKSQDQIKQRDRVFMTRCPCIQPMDGRLVPTVRQKPRGMSQSDWDWLTGLDFGAIIFANAKQGMTPLPELIADGDLDGDLYFVCWDAQMLHWIKDESHELVNVPKKVASAPGALLGNSLALASNQRHQQQPTTRNWFEAARNVMADPSQLADIDALVRNLYNLSKSTADASPLFMSDPDAIAFGEAFKEAIKSMKHLNAIPLPVHLHCKLPENLRKYLSSA